MRYYYYVFPFFACCCMHLVNVRSCVTVCVIWAAVWPCCFSDSSIC